MKLVIFDLDGTLVDSAEDIAHAVNEMRDQFELAPLPLDEIESYIGNGVKKLLERALPGAAFSTTPELTLEWSLRSRSSTFVDAPSRS